ncbi:MAG: SDR family NAD(P)-dependent oxidoreductase [Phycisphaerae bacterium]|jgi:UDP-N-acetylglucosamine 4,6-dehydratase|nr:SDR family NAD(P)-dependent oxidoreductase [Phycisphaerae bacterium]
MADPTASPSLFDGATIVITGGTGSLGAALVSLLHLRHKPARIVVFSRDERKQQQMEAQLGGGIPELRFLLGDVRDYDRLQEVMAGADVCIHAAALKHIDKCEYNPAEAVKTNVVGSMNVVRACVACGVERAILISTDKAVAPVNLYGATKLAAEKLFLAANAYHRTVFKVVRYGNVLASRGSVIETFLRLREQGVREFPITDERMTRFWIPLENAAELVLATLAAPVQVGIPRIPSMKVADLARAIDPECTFRLVGMRPGEKLHECLVSPDERVPGFEAGYYSDKNDLWLTAEELRRKVGL